MKTRDIHKAFSKADIRDFLAQKYEEASTVVTSSQNIEKEITALQEKLRLAKQREAIQELIGAQGWQIWHWDSALDLEYDIYMPFVGTGEEYDILVSTIGQEKD